jgi:hypothetical protein
MPTATPGTPATITFPTPPAPPAGQRHANLLNHLAETSRSRHYSRRTEQAYQREAGIRHANHSGVGVAQGREDDDDLYPRLESGRQRSAEPGGRFVATAARRE